MQMPWPTLSYKVLVCQLKQKLIDAIQSVCHFIPPVTPGWMIL